MGRLFQVNDQVLLDVSKRTGRGLPPIIIPSECSGSAPYYQQCWRLFDDIQVDIGSGGRRNLFDYYSGMAPPRPPPGQPFTRPQLELATFDNLENYAFEVDGFERYIQQALKSFAKQICPEEAKRRLLFRMDGIHRGQITVHRLFCIVEIDLYVAVDLSSLMDSDDYDDFIDSVTQELRQTGRTYVSQEASVRRGGRMVRDFPIVRRAGLDRYIAYLKVGIGTFVFQSGWDVDDSRVLCERGDRAKDVVEPELGPKYGAVPRRPDEPEEPEKPELEEPEPRDEKD